MAISTAPFPSCRHFKTNVHLFVAGISRISAKIVTNSLAKEICDYTEKRKYVDYVEIGWIYFLMLPLPSLFAKTPGLSFVSPSPTMTWSVYDKDYTGMSDHIHFYSQTIIVMLYSPGTFFCVCPLLL